MPLLPKAGTIGNAIRNDSQWFRKSLFQLMKEKDWAKVQMRLRTEFGRFEASRVVKGSGTKQTTTALHLACQCNAPRVVIEKLIEINPTALSIYSTNAFGKKRYLPLHVMCRFAEKGPSAQWSGDVVEVLCLAHPDAMDLACACSGSGSGNYVLPLEVAQQNHAPEQVLQALMRGSDFYRQNANAAKLSHASPARVPDVSQAQSYLCQNTGTRRAVSYAVAKMSGVVTEEVNRKRITFHDHKVLLEDRINPNNKQQYTTLTHKENGDWRSPPSKNYKEVSDNRVERIRPRVFSLDYTAVVDNRTGNDSSIHVHTNSKTPKAVIYSDKYSHGRSDLVSPDRTGCTLDTCASKETHVPSLKLVTTHESDEAGDDSTALVQGDDGSCSTLTQSVRYHWHMNTASPESAETHKDHHKIAKCTIPLLVEVPVDRSTSKDQCKLEHSQIYPSKSGRISINFLATVCFFLLVMLFFFVEVTISLEEEAPIESCPSTQVPWYSQSES